MHNKLPHHPSVLPPARFFPRGNKEIHFRPPQISVRKVSSPTDAVVKSHPSPAVQSTPAKSAAARGPAAPGASARSSRPRNNGGHCRAAQEAPRRLRLADYNRSSCTHGRRHRLPTEHLSSRLSRDDCWIDRCSQWILCAIVGGEVIFEGGRELLKNGWRTDLWRL